MHMHSASMEKNNQITLVGLVLDFSDFVFDTL